MRCGEALFMRLVLQSSYDGHTHHLIKLMSEVNRGSWLKTQSHGFYKVVAHWALVFLFLSYSVI